MHGKNSIVVKAINAWNNSQKLLQISLKHLSPNKLKKTHYIEIIVQFSYI